MSDIFKKLQKRSFNSAPTGSAHMFFCSKKDAGGQILSASKDEIIFIDENKNISRLSLIDFTQIAGLDKSYVGQRNMTADPPWVVFNDCNKTKFEFESYFLAQEILLEPLRVLGLNTIDVA
jgi:hypothetical protein